MIFDCVDYLKNTLKITYTIGLILLASFGIYCKFKARISVILNYSYKNFETLYPP